MLCLGVVQGVKSPHTRANERGGLPPSTTLSSTTVPGCCDPVVANPGCCDSRAPQADQWHLNELGHLYLADMLAWLVKHGLEQLCMRALTSSSSRPDRTELLPTPALPTSLLEPSSAPEGPSATSSKYKMCLMASGLEPYVGSRDQAWNYHSDGELFFLVRL